MRDICAKTPHGLKNLLREHVSDTGIVVYGWFNRLRNWPEARGWDSVLIYVDGNKTDVVLNKSTRGPAWIGLSVGEHQLEFRGSNDILHFETVNLSDGETILVTFKPSHQIPFLSPTPAQWCMHKLG
jgi:hypothetical protein